MGNPLEKLSFDIGWLIGIIDGEGCFCLDRKHNPSLKFYPRIQITNTNLLIIQKAKRILSDAGLTCYSYTRVPKVGKVYFRLEVVGLKRVKRFMDVYGDYFECRKEQAECLRQYVNLRLSKSCHAPLEADEFRIAKRLTELNKTGAESSETNTTAAA